MEINKSTLIVRLLVILVIFNCFNAVALAQDGAPDHYIDITGIADPIPVTEPLSPYGNPDSYVVHGKRYYVLKTANGYHAQGIASWYGTKFHGRLTSSGEPYDMFAMTAANKNLPLPCYVRVRNLENDKAIIVKVNDRGPFHEGRIIDLSYAAAKKLDMLGKGTARVEVEALTSPTSRNNSSNPNYQRNHRAQLFVQVGSFKRFTNAERLAEKIKLITHTAVNIYQADYQKQPIYRVQIGPLETQFAGEAITEELKAAGLHGIIRLI